VSDRNKTYVAFASEDIRYCWLMEAERGVVETPRLS